MSAQFLPQLKITALSHHPSKLPEPIHFFFSLRQHNTLSELKYFIVLRHHIAFPELERTDLLRHHSTLPGLKHYSQIIFR